MMKLTAVFSIIFVFFLIPTVSTADKPAKIAKPESPYDLTPVYRVGMDFEEKHTFDVYCDIRTDGKRYKCDDDNASIFKGETKLNFTIFDEEKVTVEFKKLSGTPFSEKDADKEKLLLQKMKNLKGEWIKSKFDDLSDISMKSPKLKKAIKKSLAKNDKFTEEDLAKCILARPLNLYVSPKNKVEIGETWLGEIPCGYKDLQLGKKVNYWLESVKKKGKRYIAIIKMSTDINVSDSNGGETVITIHTASGEIKFDLTNKVVEEMNFKLDYSCRSKNLYSNNVLKKFSMSAKYKFEEYGTEEIEQEKDSELEENNNKKDEIK